MSTCHTLKLRDLAVTGLLAATILAVAACAGTPSHPAAAPDMPSAAASSPPATAGNSSGPAPSPAAPASAPAPQAGFVSALAAWNTAAGAPAATRNTYLQQAADDLQAAGNSGYATAIDELTYLAGLPVTNNTPAQQATAHADTQALDSFFATPGLLS